MRSYTGSHPLEKVVKELQTELFDIADILDKPGLDEHPGDVVIEVAELCARTKLAEDRVTELEAECASWRQEAPPLMGEDEVFETRTIVQVRGDWYEHEITHWRERQV